MFAVLETDGVFSFVLSLARIIARLRSYLDSTLIILTLNGKQSNLKGNLQINYCHQMPASEHVSPAKKDRGLFRSSSPYCGIFSHIKPNQTSSRFPNPTPQDNAVERTLYWVSRQDSAPCSATDGQGNLENITSSPGAPSFYLLSIDALVQGLFLTMRLPHTKERPDMTIIQAILMMSWCCKCKSMRFRQRNLKDSLSRVQCEF